MKERRLVADRRIPWFVRWVERFQRMRGGRDRESWQDSLEVFLANLEAGGAEDWQIRQAAESITICWTQFREPGEDVVGAGLRCPGVGAWEAPAVLGEMERLLRLRHYARRTIRTYLGWAGRFLEYLGAGALRAVPSCADAKAYLTHLATRRRVSASTQNQAFSALLFLYRNVFEVELQGMADTLRAKRGRRLPVVLSVDEVAAIFGRLEGTLGLMLELVYGAGLRLNELVQLRVKDVDFGAGSIAIRAGKGDADRITILPERVRSRLVRHLGRVKALHERDLAAGAGAAPLPDALCRKYPSAPREWSWQYVFPSKKLGVADDGVIRRWHTSPATVQRAMRQAVRAAGIDKPASVHTLRHSFATHLVMQGVDVRRIQDLLGHKCLDTTMVYVHVARTVGSDVDSPLDRLALRGQDAPE